MIYKRIFLKISWEALSSDHNAINHDTIRSIAQQIKILIWAWYQVWLMVWAGNIFRWRNEGQGIDPAIGHYAGMLATMVNSLVIQNIFVQEWLPASVFSAIEMSRFIKPINKITAVSKLEQWEVVICAWGSGNPFCSTDLGSVIRALEFDCDIMVKCTNVDGIYSDDPKTNPQAIKYTNLSYHDALSQWLKVMDMSAFGMAQENNLTSFVCHIHDIAKFIHGVDHGTLVTN